jgi:hypothetical protein
MKIQISDLARLQPLGKVVVHSIDWMLYQVSVEHQGKQYFIYDGDTPFSSNNLLEIREMFQFLEVERFALLRPKSIYDEMIGQPECMFSDSFEVPLIWPKAKAVKH